LWNAAKAEEIRRLPEQMSLFNSVALSPDGKTAVTGHGQIEYKNGQPVVISAGVYKYLDIALRLWDLDEGKELHALKSYEFPVGALTFAADGKSVLAAVGTTDATAHRIDLSGEKPKEAEPVIKGASGYMRAFVVSPDGKSVLTLGPDAGAVLWEAATGKRLKQWSPAETIGGVAFSAEGRHPALTFPPGPAYIPRAAPPAKRPPPGPR